jgi:hypothetical protein
MTAQAFNLAHPCGLLISRALTESQLIAEVPTASRFRRSRYQLPPFTEADVVVAICLGFAGGKIEEVAIVDAHDQFGQTRANWAEEKEKARASSIGAWLQSKGHAVGNYPWGSIWVGYDAKGGGGEAIIRYAA